MTDRPEDQPKTLIFVDILGFAAITNQYQRRVKDHQSPDGFLISSTTEMSDRINRFNTVLDQCLFDEGRNGAVQAMLFSDCAFVVVEDALRAALIATSLMRRFIQRGVPVRVGIGKGTFYGIEYSTTTNRATMVSKSRFVGTAVVRAHDAERCGKRGMRIFLDESVEPDLAHIRQRVKAIPLAEPLKSVNWELDYLHEPRPAAEQEKVDAADRELFEKVAWLKSPDWSPDAQQQYTDTLDAMNRMRVANGRSQFNLQELRYGEPADMRL